MKSLITGLFLLLINLFVNLSDTHAQGLNHFCKSQKIVGRAVYACQAKSGVDSAASTVTQPPLTSYAKLKQSCTVSCETNSKCKKGDDKCEKACPSKCEADHYKANAKTLLSDIKNYDTACNVSKGGAKCEQSEAKAFCDYSLYSSAKKYSSPKNFNDYKALIKYHAKVVKAYQNRSGNLDKEIKEYSANMRKAVNDKLGCEHLPESFSICASAQVKVSLKDPLEQLHSTYAYTIEKTDKAVCQKGKGCVEDACTANRDDNAYTTEADGSTCFCDEYCCQAGDCCGNFTNSCSAKINVTKCMAAAFAPEKAISSIDYNYLRSLKKLRD